MAGDTNQRVDLDRRRPDRAANVLRFIVQWVATKRARASIIPETFWYFSFFGGALLLAYARYRVDPVFILGQATGLMIYSRNLYFIRLGKRGLSPAKLV
jgi:lipid-A-disaccharide synthase-like uncharacterized protein